MLRVFEFSDSRFKLRGSVRGITAMEHRFQTRHPEMKEGFHVRDDLAQLCRRSPNRRRSHKTTSGVPTVAANSFIRCVTTHRLLLNTFPEACDATGQACRGICRLILLLLVNLPQVLAERLQAHRCIGRLGLQRLRGVFQSG